MVRIALAVVLIMMVFNSSAQIPVALNFFTGTSNVKINDQRQEFGLNYGLGLTSYLRIPIDKVGLFIEPAVGYLRTAYSARNSSVDKVRVGYGTTSALLILSSASDWDLKDGDNDQHTVLFGIGGFYNMALAGKFNYDTDASFTKMKFGNKLADNRAVFDGGLAIKFGYGFGKGTMTIQKNIGMRNVMPQERIAQSGEIVTRNFMFQMNFLIF